MRRWWRAARPALTEAADHAALWLPGALAWSLTLGWIPLLVVVSRPPTVADLTFMGARLYTDAAWPWNAVAAVAGALLLACIGFLLVTLAEARLLDRGIRRRQPPGVATLLGIGVVAAAPVVATLLATGTAAVIVAMREFTAPTPGDPMLRTVARLTPFLVAVGLAWIAGGVIHAAASRSVASRRVDLAEALLGVPATLRRAGLAGMAHALLLSGARLGYLVVALALLGVLWGPIGIRFGGGGVDAAALPLLVGFVAIWICLVLGGGALHAWGSLTWTRLLVAGDGGHSAADATGSAYRS